MRTLFFLMIGGLAFSLAGCGESDGKAGTRATSSKAAEVKNGFVIKSGDLTIDGTVSAAKLPGYLRAPLSIRIMGGWIDRDKIKRAAQETDEAEKRKQAMGSFGTIDLHLAAGKAEPGSYELAAEEGGPQTGTVKIDKDEDLGLASQYTSQSGTLTIKSLAMNDDGTAVAAVEGEFDGQFSSDDGDSRQFSGHFRYVPKKK